jgi:mannose-6-phosphate isomerase-like protein (cupin superfamily)
MDEKQLMSQLSQEGFTRTYVWEDGPDAVYPDHSHDEETAHIILRGEMTLTMNGKTSTFRAAQRCDVPAGTIHSARMGPQGCRYLIGER